MNSDMAPIEPADGRGDPRTNLFLSATVEVDGCILPVRIRNLSTQGAMIESPALPRSGTAIVVERTGLKVGGILRWAQGQRAGVRFDHSIDVVAWSPSRLLSRRNQGDVDCAIAAARAMPLSPPPPPPRSIPPGEQPLRDSIGIEVRGVAAMLEVAGATLAGDPAMIDRHLERLQEFDLAAQVLVELAALLSSHDPVGALQNVTLTDLRRRLMRTHD